MPEKTALQLFDPVIKIPLIGEKYKRLLKKLEIEKIEDLLYHFPFRYEDFSKVKKISELLAGEPATVKGQILEIKNITTKYRKRLTKGVIADDSGQLLLVWFNQPFIVRNVKKGDFVSVSGKLSIFNSKPAFVSPEYETVRQLGSQAANQLGSGAVRRQGRKTDKLSNRQTDKLNTAKLNTAKLIHTGRLVPIYPETRGVSSKWLRSRIAHLFRCIDTIDDFLPERIKEKHDLWNLEESLRKIHFPQSQKETKKAKERLAFEELFLIQLNALKRREEWKRHKVSYQLSVISYQSKVDQFVKSLPFELTKAQKRCIKEILSDLEKKEPMNRLLEGDVGSGKTVVATIAMYVTFLNGLHSLLMAPTEILAEQHFVTIKKFLEPFGIRTGLQTGSRKTAKWSNGQMVNVLIGTHALLYDHTQLDKLGLIVIDEQHRFGVEQRAKLIKSSERTSLAEDGGIPHTLTMTATPIPRTMALTFYGDLDLSFIDEMPPGRKPVSTFVVPKRKRGDAYGWIEKKVKEGEQVFIICPLIEESRVETLQSVKAATVEFEKLKKEIFPKLNLGLIHGRVKSKEKDKILSSFRDQKLDILVSTPVVEVGIDIPNATTMLIEGAERFGLASLHQLRGRVGRGEKESYCLLFTESHSRQVYQRLKALEKYHEGLKLAEIDLKLRGPGEIYGTRQHGIPNLKIASFSDLKLIEETREAAKSVLKESSTLKNYPSLKERLERVTSRFVAPN